ncbi:MAG: hypothetical protein ACR2OJ_16190 [Hyphomicrobiales bacterium]
MTGLVSLAQAKADWLNLTGAETAPNIAEIEVMQDGVTIVLEIFLQNAKHFVDILPDKAFGENPPERPSLDERLQRFAREGVRVETFSGETLPVRIKSIEPATRKDRKTPFAGMINPQTGRKVPDAPQDKRVIKAELFYPFTTMPEGITISPPKGDDDIPLVSIGFILHHMSVPVIDFRYLSKSAKLSLDWDDPWYSKFENPNLKRHHKDALMGFLYVEPRRVRQEALIRIRDLEKWADLALPNPEIIAVGDQEKVLAKAAQFLADTNTVSADGKKLTPSASRAVFIEIGTSGITVIEEPKPLDRKTALVGIVTTYEVDHLPKDVTLDWKLFDARQKTVPVTLFDPAGPFLSFATSDDNAVKWQNFLKQYREPEAKPVAAIGLTTLPIPLISLVLLVVALIAGAAALRSTGSRRQIAFGVAGASIIAMIFTYPLAQVRIANPFAPTPDETELSEIAQKLVENLYVALDEHDAKRRAIALNTSADNSSAAPIEAESKRGLVVGLAGGSEARSYAISNMKITNIAPLDDPGGVSAVATWTAQVKGGHWGHVHRRNVEFEAQMELMPEDGNWKIAGLTITRRQ